MDRQRVRRNRTFRPQLETLENRWCPSVSVNVYPSIHTLVVQGDSADNAVAITADGSGGVSANITGSSGTASGSGTGITNVLVNTRGGSDTVAFKLDPGPLTSRLNLGIDLGYYQDGSGTTNKVDLDFSPGVSSTYLNIGVLGTRGKDNVTASFGPITESYVYFGAYLDGGDDSFDATLGDIDEYAVAIAAFGGSGTDTLGVHVTGDISAGTYLGVLLDGGSGGDTINFDYSGVMNGKLGVALVGGYGKDTITGTIDVDSSSSGGKVAAAVFGGDGDDDLTLHVNDPGNTLASLYALLDGGAGTDTCDVTPNVTVINCP
jgi:hypothetical protein